MNIYKELTKNIPWKSCGRETIASRVAQSLLPVGFLPFQPLPPDANRTAMYFDAPDIATVMMHIVGTAIQAGYGKLVTCAHVVEILKTEPENSYLLNRIQSVNHVRYQPYAIPQVIPYYDPRTEQPNPSVDLSVMLVPIKTSEAFPYDVPSVTWGDSTQLGVGDPVFLGGYPYGRDMFLCPTSNRGLVQPTFYSGIISAIIPTMAPHETRILQISTPVAGGMSGGAVFLPKTGEVVGLVTSGLNDGDSPLPATYAIPSEVIALFLEVITFEVEEP